MNNNKEMGQKPSWDFKNMKSDLLSLVLLDDRVRKITCPCQFCNHKYERTSGFFGLCPFVAFYDMNAVIISN